MQNVARLMPVAAALICSLTACGLMLAGQPSATHLVTLPAARSSVLVVIVDRNSPAAAGLADTLLTQSSRVGERVIVLDEGNGGLLASSISPMQPSQRVPGPPSPLPADPTTFQKARYKNAINAYKQRRAQAQQALRHLTQANLATWARNLTVWTRTGSHLPPDGADLSAALDQAAATLGSLRQSGDGSGTPTTIAIIGVNPAIVATTPAVPASFAGSTVVVSDFQGTANQEAAWQADLDQAGADRAVVLTPATDNQLNTAVRQGLDGAVTDTLTSVSFGLGQYTLTSAALPQLRTLLRLLTASYPSSTASIVGYTDNLPVADGNIRLSQRRAQAVLSWLVASHVAVSRLQAAGYGDSDPLAPNTPFGQPLNRRVVVIIDPMTSQTKG